MSELSGALYAPLSFIAALLTLAWLSRQISIHIQIPIYYGTRSKDAPTVALFLIFLPGIFIHESAHWIMAKLFGLRTGKFRVWPTRKGKHIGLGSVDVDRGGVVADSLVGLAPLIVGTLLIGLISHYIFATNRIINELATGNLPDVMQAIRATLAVEDGLLWAYLLFTIANSMMPSASDREPLKPVLVYGLTGVILYFMLGLSATVIQQIVTWLLPTIQNLTSAFTFTILLNSIVLIVLFVIRKLFRMG